MTIRLQVGQAGPLATLRASHGRWVRADDRVSASSVRPSPAARPLGHEAWKRTSASTLLSRCPSFLNRALAQVIQQRIRLKPVGRIEPLAETGVDWRQQLDGASHPTFRCEKAGQARRRARLERARTLLVGKRQRMLQTRWPARSMRRHAGPARARRLAQPGDEVGVRASPGRVRCLAKHHATPFGPTAINAVSLHLRPLPRIIRWSAARRARHDVATVVAPDIAPCVVDRLAGAEIVADAA